MKKTIQKKKKLGSNANLYLKLNEKNDKINFKFALNMLIPKGHSQILSPKHNEPIKSAKISGVVSPKSKIVKKSTKDQKQNQTHTTFISHNNSGSNTPLLQNQTIQIRTKCRNDYKFLYQVGSGGFGRVWKVQDKKNSQILAMKEISKAKVIMKKSVDSVVNEKNILENFSNGYIINMKSAFQDREYLYLTMQYLRGGDLRYHLCFYEFFSEIQTKFIASCIVLGLQYVHSKGIIHRDLKPENLVFEESGFLRITDFGVARKKKTNNSDETSGTPGYMSPEVICRMNHSYESDFFGLGVILYEMVLGSRPYMGDSRKQIRDKILAHQARISEKDLPPGWSPESIDFINKLIKRNKESRLGHNGINELKQHPWLANINWKKMSKKEIKPLFIPGIVTESREYQKEMESTSETEPSEEAEMLLRTPQIQHLFKGYGQLKKQTKKSSKMY